jgi:hypothetical protein
MHLDGISAMVVLELEASCESMTSIHPYTFPDLVPRELITPHLLTSLTQPLLAPRFPDFTDPPRTQLAIQRRLSCRKGKPFKRR